MKTFQFITYAVFAILFTTNACTKADNQQPAEVQDQSETTTQRNTETFMEFYVNDVQVPSIAIDTTDDQWIHYVATTEKEYQVLQVRKYSTRQLFEAHGDAVGIDFRHQLAIADHLRAVADSAGLITTVTAETQVPQWYLEYAQKMVNGFTGSELEERFIGTELKKTSTENCSSWNGTNFLPGVVFTQPAFTFWNNKTSGVRNVDVWGSFNMWDKYFFRKYLGSVTGFGLVTVPLCGTVADRRTSSAIRYGL